MFLECQYVFRKYFILFPYDISSIDFLLFIIYYNNGNKTLLIGEISHGIRL